MGRWGVTLDTGWSDWDAEVFGHPWTCLRLTTVQEDHGSGRRLIRLKFRFAPTWLTWTALAAAGLSIALAACWQPAVAVVIGLIAALAFAGAHRRGVRLAGKILEAIDRSAGEMGLTPCGAGAGRPSASA